MKINLSKENRVNASEIDDSYIVVGIHNDGSPVILADSEHMSGRMKFIRLEDVMHGNCWTYTANGARLGIEEIINKFHGELEVFHKEDLKSALQWLIDNA